jgi:transcriptional regulator
VYIPDSYQNKDFQSQLEFIKANGFAILVTHNQQTPIATHIPVQHKVIDDKLILYGHISRLNHQAETFNTNSEALVIFNGPHAYVSSSWYSHDNVSTWNYRALHCYGALTIQSEMELLESLIDLTNHYESKEQRPHFFEAIDPKVIRENLTGIIGFNIMVNQILAIDKLSQNRNDHDYHQIIHHLFQRKDSMSQTVAEEMQLRKPGAHSGNEV